VTLLTQRPSTSDSPGMSVTHGSPATTRQNRPTPPILSMCSKRLAERVAEALKADERAVRATLGDTEETHDLEGFWPKRRWVSGWAAVEGTTMSDDRGWIEFTDGSRWYAKPRERPCVCIEGVQRCAYHARPPVPEEQP
jgi:hypothetical protein